MTDRLAIGGNNPPAFDGFSLALDDAYDTAKDFLDGKPIENQGQADAIGRIMGEVRKLKKDADEARKEEKRPHDEAGAAVQTKWRPLLDRADTILTAAQRPLTVFLEKLQAEQREAETKAREEAAQKAAEAVEASRAAEGSVEAIEHARALEKEADKAAKDAAKLGKTKAHVAGMGRAIGLRSHQVATVTCARDLLNHIARHDPEPLKAWLGDYAQKALPSQLPGVTIETERKVA